MSPRRSAARRTLSAALGLCAAALATLAACADAPTAPGTPGTPLAPSATARREIVDPAVYSQGLKRRSRIDAPIVTQVVIDKHGGKYRLPAGLQLEVEPTTFDTTVTLTVTAIAGDMVAYEFQPHGLTFKKQLKFRQDLRGTNWEGHDRSKFEIGYFASSADLRVAENKALIREYLRADLDTKGAALHFGVVHFSGYMVSTGRLGAGDDTGFDN